MKDLNKILNIADDSKDTIVKEKPTNDEKLDDDFEFARTNLYDVIGQSASAMQDMVEVAKQSQHPRAYEVLNQMFKTAVEMNKDLIDLQKKKKELTASEDNQQPGNLTQNLFVGSTAELQELLARKRIKPSE